MVDGDELVMISALQHYLFCPRQCALIHVEGSWSENFLTTTGRRLHEKADSGRNETRRNVHAATALRLVSHRLGVTGIADVVEFHLVADERDANGVRIAGRLPGRDGWWKPFPVEYKRGRPKSHRADEVQLCAQAICLEEMFAVSVEKGALYYGETKRRVEIEFGEELRQLTESTTKSVAALIASGSTPAAIVSKGCEACSMIDLCRPYETTGRESVSRWLSNAIEEAIAQ